MTDISNLTGLEKPLTKLIETVSEGIGELGNVFFEFDARKIKRVGEAEALREKEMIVKRAEGEAEANNILVRASKRFALEQYTKQVNLENTIYQASELLIDERVDNRAVDKDWTMRFLDTAQNISDEDIQYLLAQILANEVKEPSIYSKRVLDVLKNVSREELTVFKKFLPYANEKGSILIGRRGRSAFFEQFGLSFQEYVDLCDAGLINASSSIGLTFEDEDDTYVSSANVHLHISVKQHEKVNIAIVPFTIAGTQIAGLLQQNTPTPDSIERYISDIVDELQSQGAVVTRKSISESAPNEK